MVLYCCDWSWLSPSILTRVREIFSTARPIASWAFVFGVRLHQFSSPFYVGQKQGWPTCRDDFYQDPLLPQKFHRDSASFRPSERLGPKIRGRSKQIRTSVIGYLLFSTLTMNPRGVLLFSCCGRCTPPWNYSNVTNMPNIFARGDPVQGNTVLSFFIFPFSRRTPPAQARPLSSPRTTLLDRFYLTPRCYTDTVRNFIVAPECVDVWFKMYFIPSLCFGGEKLERWRNSKWEILSKK